MHTYKQLTFVFIIILLFIGAVSVQAQTEVRTNTTQQIEVRASSDTDEKCEVGVDCPEDEVESANYNNSRSNRANISDTDADGREDIQTRERCEDGVCTEAEEAEGASYNNSRSNRATVAPDGDLDGDGYGDVEMRERCEDGVCSGTEAVQEANYNNSRSNRSTVVGDGEGGGQSDAAETDVTGEIILGEDRDMVMPGDNKSDLDDNDNTDRANYNNSRSNRATIVGGGNDGPLDQVRKGTIKRLDKASPKLITTLGIDNDSPIKDDGVELYVRGDVCGTNDEDCDDDGVPTSPSARDLTLHVSGERVRGWNPDQKAEVSRRLQAAGTSTTANDFGLRVAQVAINNDNVADIASNNQATEVSFQTRLRLLGFIPARANATARADAAGEVTVDYPWYSFLASKGDSSIFSSLAADLRAAHEAMISVEEEGAPRTVRSDEQEN